MPACNYCGARVSRMACIRTKLGAVYVCGKIECFTDLEDELRGVGTSEEELADIKRETVS